MRVLVACEYSGIVRDAFLEKGHIAVSCDILPSESNKPDRISGALPYGGHYQGDVLDILEDGWDLMIAHPPCTHLSVSGQRWFPPHRQPGEPGFKPSHLRDEALEFVQKLMDAPIPKICIENPVSIISGRIRKADQLIHPWQHGHPEQKRTCLWLKNLPKLKETNNVHDYMMTLPLKQRARIWWMGSKKGKERSRFYEGIAAAMADQWG